MIAACCLTLAGVHLLIWFKDRQEKANLAFSVLAACVAAVAGFEFMMMRAQTVPEFGAFQRWMLVPVFVGIAAILAFVRFYFHTGRLWLAHATWVGRLIGLVINFTVEPNIFYREITGLHQIQFFGTSVTVAQAVPGHWLWVDQLSALMLVVFAADASLMLWRRGNSVDRRRALVVGLSLTVFLFLACTLVALVHSQIIAAPYFVSIPFLIMVAAMGHELSRDVLRAAKLAAELRETEQRMELAADAANLGLWVWEIPADEIWVTDKGRALFGIAKSQPLNFARFEETLHPDDRHPVRQAVQKALEGSGEYQTEFRVRLPEGGARWINAYGRVEFGAQRQALRLRGTVIDITQSKQAAVEAKQSRDALAHAMRVSVMGELSVSLAHELNQPLSAILNNAQAAERFLGAGRPDIDEVREALRDIAEDGNRAGEVIRRMRAMVKRTEVELLSLEIERVIRDVADLVHSDAVLRAINVTLDLAPGLPLVRGDHVQLQQVVLNLMLNAFDAVNGAAASDRGVTVRAAMTDPRRLRVSVEDRGTGLSADGLGRIFEPFYTTKPHGLGMGLVISRSIIEAHGGRLWGECNPDRGATFHFELPIVGKP
ncbi:MAG: Adaptive-response sensory-kinase SasA [Verrucomicrobiae bacterium]|nr:Adaptive-response sensory-kinase SasA [Verrucomicrobiae bacterium]